MRAHTEEMDIYDNTTFYRKYTNSDVDRHTNTHMYTGEISCAHASTTRALRLHDNNGQSAQGYLRANREGLRTAYPENQSICVHTI